jgi:hypothetical protein
VLNGEDSKDMENAWGHFARLIMAGLLTKRNIKGVISPM